MFNNPVRLFYEGLGGSGPGGSLTITELADPNFKPNNAAPVAPKPGDADYVEPKIGEPGYVLKEGDPGFVAPKIGEPGYVLKEGDPGYIAPKIGEPGYMLKEGDPGYEAPVEEEIVPFWEEVEEITGVKVDVTYPDGIEPDTPQGAAVREQAVRRDEALRFEEHIRTTYPRAYAYLLHNKTGGTDDAFFTGKQGDFKLPTMAELEASADVQTALFKYDLTTKGVSQAVVDLALDAAIKNGTLKTDAVIAYNGLDAAQKQQITQLQNIDKENQRAFQQAAADFDARLTASMDDMGFVVSDAQRAEFKKFVIDNVRFDNGNFFIVQPVGADSKDIKRTLESMFFQFKKGDLKSIIAKKVGNETVQRLKTSMKKTTQQQQGGPGGSSGTDKFVPLSALA